MSISKSIFAILLCVFIQNVAAAIDNQQPITQTNSEKHSVLDRTQQMVTDSSEYTIGLHDLLEIEVFRIEELARTVRVNSRGEISMPLIGRIVAAGFSSQELEEKIANRLEKDMLQNAHVSVFIKEYASQRITIEGAVNKPGMYPLAGKTTLLQSIALASGFTNLANVKEVQLFRKSQNGIGAIYEVNVDAIRHGKAIDPTIEGNDIIVVHKGPVKAFLRTFVDTIRGFVTFGSYEIFN